MEKLILLAEENAPMQMVDSLKEKLGIPVVTVRADENDEILYLHATADGLSLERGKQALRGDFARLLKRIKPSLLASELAVRAVRGRDGKAEPTVIDATAGLGEDAFLLAASGCSLKLYERDPIICALLQDALRRALLHPETAEIARRMEVFEQDSIQAMPHLSFVPDAVFLDPMFPEKEKNALTKKKFQILHHLERPCEQEEALLRAAFATHARKIVVKRPLKASPLASYPPQYALKGKTVRYDCLLPPMQASRSAEKRENV